MTNPRHSSPPPLDPFPGALGSFGLSPRPAAPQRHSDPLLGTDCGGVRIVSLLAEGGMGRVYLGEQARPRRPVAVKVMRSQRTTAKGLQRFLRETEVLGHLLHAGIARIYTAGSVVVAGDDVPFVVMEYVEDGLPITTYADRTNASLERRVRLFRDVCDAVASAHVGGFVHRDLKPGNILVDREGRVKVIDFGVAFSVGADASARSVGTTFGDMAGTLQYMSPEQLHGDPRTIGSRSDVYALGLVLHELVVGSLPYDVSQMSLHDATQTICHKPAAAALRRARHVPRGLASIIRACLRKRASRRFADAGSLATAVAGVTISPAQSAAFLAGPRPAGAPGRWRGPSRRLAGIVATVCLAACLNAVFFPRQHTREPAVAADPIPAGWIRRGDSLYLFTTEQLTLPDAIRKAREIDASLVVIDDEAENAFVTEHLHGRTWLGLVNRFIASFEKDVGWKEFAARRGGWAIIDGLGRPAYFHWREGQPQGFLHEVGASIHTNGLWYDHFWTDRLYTCFERRVVEAKPDS